MGTLDPNRVVTKSRLVTDLRALGVAPGDAILLHESVRNIGWIVGGPDVVLDAVCEVLGPEGTLLKLVGSEDGLYEAAEWPAHVRDAYVRECPPYDRARTRGSRAFGLLAEYLRTRAGAERSDHPEESFVAVGKHARWITSGHPLVNGYGEGSPLDKLVQLDGKVLNLGAPLDTATLLHLAEYRARLPHKRVARYQAPIVRDGERVLVDVMELDSSHGIVDWNGGADYFEPIVRSFLAGGGGTSGTVGHAESHSMPARALVEHAIEWMETHLGSASREDGG